MEMKLQTNRLILFIIVNVILLVFLYNVPIAGNEVLENLCIYKFLCKKECWNCGMTRACLSIIQGKYNLAINYNWKSIFIFPFAILIYIHSWYKFAIKKQ